LSILLYSFNFISYPTLNPELIAHSVVGMHGGIDQKTILEMGYLAQFLIKQMYTQLEVAKIIYHHQPHTHYHNPSYKSIR
jgi:hypothetical protein